MAVKRNKSRHSDEKSARSTLTPMQDGLLKEANRRVTIVSDGRQQEVRVHDVVARKLLQMAANGSVHALSNAVNEINSAQRMKLRMIQDDVTFGEKFKEHQQRLLDAALKQGDDPNSVLPHPDDVDVIYGQGYKITGPTDEAQLKLILTNCYLRDAAIIQFVLEERIGDRDDQNSADPFPGASALIIVQFMNHRLPERFCQSDAEIMVEMKRYQRLTKRELLKAAHRAWATIGHPKPRGWMLPNYRRTVSTLEHLTAECFDLLGDMKSGKLVSDQTIAARILKLAS